MNSPKYKNAGVDLAAGSGFAERLRVLNPSLGGFFAAAPLPQGLREPVLLSSCDGVGTKLLLLAEAGLHEVAGRDLVAMCANDLACSGAKPWLFLDYYACGSLEPEVALAVVEGIRAACGEIGCSLAGGETAELPGILASGSYDLAGTVIGVAERREILDPNAAKAGDAILGIRTETLGCNGFSLVRSLLKDGGEIPLDLGQEINGRRLGDLLLAPAPLYKCAIDAARAAVRLRSAAHITGGGLPANLPRALPEGMGARLDRLSLPALHCLLQEAGSIDDEEMRNVFNHGVGLALVVAADDAAAAVEALAGQGWDAQRIGVVVSGRGVEFA